MAMKTRAGEQSNRPEFLLDELSLSGSGARYRREIGGYWSFGDDRVFGGYTAALCLIAMAQTVKLPALLSCQVQFVGATRTGETEIVVETLVQGRSAASLRAVLYQKGLPTVSVQCWLGDRLAVLSPTGAPTAPAPLACPAIDFRARLLPFMGVLDERAIDYPDDDAGFQNGPPRVDLWIRPRHHAGVQGGLLSQLFDVIAFDAHMLDAARRARASTQIVTASLDLSVMWHSTLPLEAWRQVQVEAGSAMHGFAATTAVMLDERGGQYATAFQQGRARAMSSR